METEITHQETNMVRLYQGSEVPGAQDVFYQQPKAYHAINLLMMEGQDGERIRICIEGQHPNVLYIHRWPETLDVLVTLFRVQCKYAYQQITEGKRLPNPLIRGERKANFDQICAAGKTVAFTSTSRNTLCDDFVIGKQDPYVLHITLGERIPYLDFEDFFGSTNSLPEEHEVLLPPEVIMTFGHSWTQMHDEIGPVRHCNIECKGLDTNVKPEDETLLIEYLNTNTTSAAEALCDIVRNKLEAYAFKDTDHIYWKWKTAFRKLAIQRMHEVYKHYFS